MRVVIPSREQMATQKYRPCFSCDDAPYMMGRRMTPCKDVRKLRADVRRVSLARDCANVEQLVRFKFLEHVECELHEGWLNCLAELPRLKWVELTLPKCGRIPSLRCLSHIRALVVRCNRHQTNLRFLSGLKSVRSLCVSEASSVTKLNPISRLVSLQELYLDGTVSGIWRVETLSPISKLTDLRFAVLLVRSAQPAKPLRHLLALKKLGYLHLASSYLKNQDELQQLVDDLPRLKRIGFNGGLTWPKKTT